MIQPTSSELAILSRAAIPRPWDDQTRTNSRCLDRAAASCRTLGGCFALVGSFPLLLVAFLKLNGMNGPADIESQILGFVDTLILVGPGVWYFIAATLLRRCHLSASNWTLYVAVSQLALIFLFVAFSLSVAHAGFVLLPVILSLFFLPALIALIYELYRARRAIIVLSPVTSAFSPILLNPQSPSAENNPASSPSSPSPASPLPPDSPAPSPPSILPAPLPASAHTPSASPGSAQ